MYILLTDALSCPRCGPGFGLLVQADRLEERRVVEGRLGCANCRETYPVRGGVAHLSPGATTNPAPSLDPGDDPEAPVKLAALMGLAGARGLVLLEGPGTRHAAALATLVPEVEVVAVDGASGPMQPGVSRVRAGAALPFRDGTMRGAALTGGAGEARLREALRVLAPGARLLVHPAAAETAARLRSLGARVLLEQEGVVVAAAPGRPVQLGAPRRG
ncbi:MAG: hypothetical protein KY444_01275 [Gemmatimonadetes bacterium]|nr:hypothetical protein [Gemmatimonadota bacterium]